MRQVLSLSLAQKTAKKVKGMAKKRGFASVSAYIKHLIDLDKDLISEIELLDSIEQARKEYKTGKTISAKSMADLV